jgi:pyruvate, water dikinase
MTASARPTTDPAPKNSANVRWFSGLGLADLAQVGGKNSSLGEMVSNLAAAGVRVPDGFARRRMRIDGSSATQV